MTLGTFLAAWALISVVSSLMMGRWLGGRDLISQFVAPIQFCLDDD